MRKISNKFLLFLMVFFLGLCFANSNSFVVRGEESTYSSLLEKEPIDVVIKYIDLTDSNLKREGIPQIKKDEDNGELKYVVRSVLQNMPWVRKIFIVMPNEKVRYFKDPKDISDKIVYIKDKDLLGFDSAAIHSFQFNFWKLRKFGVSNNFIYMDDDYFIGKPLKKSDFFYEKNGKIVPYVIYEKKLSRNSYSGIKWYYRDYKRNIKSSHPHDSGGFRFQKSASWMFLYNIFGKNMLAPLGDLDYFPHNALGENIDELKEVYDLVKSKYKYANECLYSKIRHNNALVHQTVYSFYILNKYNRKVNNLRGDYIDLANADNADYNVPLFCINTGGNGDYSSEQYAKAKVMMNKLFPKMTKYETAPIQNGKYIIESALTPYKVLDINEESKENCANLQLWTKKWNSAQKFNVKLQGDGTYTLEAECSNKLLDVQYSGETKGTNIWQFTPNDTPAQKWYIIPAEKGFYYIVSATNNLCMDVDGAKTLDGTNVQCWEPNGRMCQKFKFVKVD